MPWSEGKDAPLSARGQLQAAALAADLAQMPKHRVISSPHLRAQQTATPLAKIWKTVAEIEPRFSEVPLAANKAKRSAWLTDVMTTRWENVDGAINAWREAAWEGLLSLQGDSVIFTHYMLINALVTRATDDEKLVCLEPDYVSVTHLQTVPHERCSLIGHLARA